MDTFGWDTIAVIRTDQVNSQLALHASELPLDFHADPGTDPPVIASGRFASWRIVPGGAAQIVYLALAIEQGVLSIGAGTPPPAALTALAYRRPAAAEAAALAEYDLAGVTVVVALDLRLLNDAESVDQRLVFRLEQVGTSLPPAGPGYVTPVTIVDPSGALSVAAKSLLGFAVASDLVGRADEVRYVLASVSPVPPSTNGWLAPTASKYAYAAQETGGEGCLAILSVTGGRDPSGLPEQLDPGTLGGTSTESYVISPDMVLEHVMLPALPSAYDTGADSFRFDRDAHVVREARRFKTFSVKSGAIDYYPEITSFEMRIAGDALRTRIAGECDMYAGIRMSFSIGVSNAATFDTQSRTLSFAADPAPDSSYNADIPWYLMFLGPLALAITQICVKVISSDIAGRLSDSTRTALSIVQDPPQVVRWTGSDGFDVQVAGLDWALYMMGQPLAIPAATGQPVASAAAAGAAR